MSTIQAPRGTQDVLPFEFVVRRRIEDTAGAAALCYGYEPIVTPTIEHTELFARTSGEGSDVVTKEMYTFPDRAGRSLTLRPEGTAGICRAYVEHGLHREPQPVKFFAFESMFRYAAPQKGRFREFWQLDVEAIGSPEPALDAEQIRLFVEILRQLGIEGARLELNSIGDRACRPAYLDTLRRFLAEHESDLDDDARTKARTSPLRVFDTKNPRVRAVLDDAPRIGDSLCDDCRAHFDEVKSLLDAFGVSYELVPALVRGLDYYTRTVYEFVNDALDAAESTICAGGRYDYLVEEIGGPPTPGVGWASGVERVAMSVTPERDWPRPIDVFFLLEQGGDRTAMLSSMMDLRAKGWLCDADYAGRSVKGQLTQAKRLRAKKIIRVGPDTDIAAEVAKL